MKVIAEIEKFQSTLPREERLSSQARLIWWHQHFNPRSHERSDNQKGKRMAREKISIHAPTRGATQHDRMAGHRRNHFNPRSHERSDDKNHSGLLITQNFNPRSHERSDYDSIGITLIHENFNPRSHERSDY